MATAQKPDIAPRAAETQPLEIGVDGLARQITIKQRRSRLAVHPDQVVLTFDTLELLFSQVYPLSLAQRGLMQQASVVPPSDSRSDLSRPLPHDGSRPQ